MYTGTVQLASNTLYGEWIVTQLPQAIFLDSVEVTARINRANRAPEDFKIYGSNDGNTWYELLAITGAAPKDGTSGTIYGRLNSNDSYNRFAIIITKTVGGGTSIGIDDQDDSPCIAELQYVGNDKAYWDTPYGGPISIWNVSQVTDMSGLFAGKTIFDGDISDWDVSNVTNMEGMFQDTSFNQPIADWDVSSVTDMSDMFRNNLTFNQPIGDWNVSIVTDMSSMFYNAISFNQDIGDWNVSIVTDMSSMLYNAI